MIKTYYMNRIKKKVSDVYKLTWCEKEWGISLKNFSDSYHIEVVKNIRRKDKVFETDIDCN